MTRAKPKNFRALVRNLRTGKAEEIQRTMQKAKLSIPEPKWNKTEAAYAQKLSVDPSVDWFAFEPMKLRLAAKCFYSPDFGVLTKEGDFHFVEVKGFWRDDARVKIKTAARLFPMFQFVAARKTKDGWEYEAF